jgi:hypothetical protein
MRSKFCLRSADSKEAGEPGMCITSIFGSATWASHYDPELGHPICSLGPAVKIDICWCRSSSCARSSGQPQWGSEFIRGRDEPLKNSIWDAKRASWRRSPSWHILSYEMGVNQAMRNWASEHGCPGLWKPFKDGFYICCEILYRLSVPNIPSKIYLVFIP